MRLSPRTAEQAQRLRALAYTYASKGEEVVHLLGFDWKVVVSVMGPPASQPVQALVLGTQSDMCWRALLYVSPTDVHGRTKVHVLEIGGGGAFALNYHTANRNLHWCSPEEAVVAELRLLSRW